jgi:hypothetical protein
VAEELNEDQINYSQNPVKPTVTIQQQTPQIRKVTSTIKQQVE